MSAKTVGIDIQSTIGPKTGIGYYTENLIKSYGQTDNIDFIYYKNSDITTLDTLTRVKWESFCLPAYAKKDNIDILHITGFAGPAVKGKYKRVTTVHDLIGMIYPKNLAPVSRFYWQKLLPFCIKKSDFIIADSENTKRDIINFIGFPSERIKVIYLAADKRFKPIEKLPERKKILEKYGINKKYVLNVGTVEPRKNIPRLIEAFSVYIKESKLEDLVLVIAGKKDWGYEKCRQKIEELGIGERIIFCDYVNDEELVILYNLAEAFIYPSFYEGFGLPVLEAMSCGVPVICSQISSLPEVAEYAGIYIDPSDIGSIKAALSDALKNKESLSARSLKQAGKFSWEKTAAETINVYKEVLN